MSNNELPFYTQAALLDKYIKEIDPKHDARIIEVILDVLRQRQDLRRYFFRNRPSPIWAEILWDNGFFNEPPPPEELEGEIKTLPRWDVQDFLINVAERVPEVVIKQIQTIESKYFYTAQAIRALCKIPPSKAVLVKNRINDWLNDPEIATERFLDPVYDYIALLIRGEFIEDAIGVFVELSKPRLKSEFGTVGSRHITHGKTVTLYDNIMAIEYKDVQILDELIKRKPASMAKLYSDHLGMSLRLEGKALERPEYEKDSWWRVAVEETGQDLGKTANEKILKRFLLVLEHWADIDFNAFKCFISKLLEDDRRIFYRVGLYLLGKYPNDLTSFVEQELHKDENLDDTEIRHEFFLLLQKGFSVLSKESQDKLIKSILSGPPQERIDFYSDLYQTYTEERELSLTEYIETRKKLWIRDRLWMIRKDITRAHLNKLNSFLEQYGEPDHPTFYRWSSGAGFVRNVSPISNEELSSLSPTQLLKYVEKWEPGIEQHDIFIDRNYRGLAKEIAKVVFDNTDEYKGIIIDLAKIRPVIPWEVLWFFHESEKISFKQWKIILDMCDGLLSDESIKKGDDWTRVRYRIAALISVGFKKEKSLIPESLLYMARNLLHILVYDIDPMLEDEPKPKMGENDFLNDPLTYSLNHVRPVALEALIQYTIHRVKTSKPKNRLEDVIKQVFIDKLDKTKEKSLSIHSVFGRSVSALYWLDADWTQKNIGKIFPNIVNQDTLFYFQSAWDSYVHNAYNLKLKDLMKEFYLTAVETIAYGFVSRPDAVQGFAFHIVYDFLFNNYGEEFPDNDSIPIVRFFNKGKPEDTATVAWACWRICQENLGKCDEWWPKLRLIWDWRLQESIYSNHSSDFDQEMRNFAGLLEFVPEKETIVSLYPLLEGMLPHIVNIEYRDKGWDAVEKFLSTQVEKHPVECIQLYYLMREQRGKLYVWHQETDEAKRIIENGVENKESREKTLSLIDYLFSINNYSYEEIYLRHTQ